MTLAQQTATYLARAGIAPNDPGLIQVKRWNAAAYARRRAELEQAWQASHPRPPTRPELSTPAELNQLGHTATDPT